MENEIKIVESQHRWEYFTQNILGFVGILLILVFMFYSSYNENGFDYLNTFFITGIFISFTTFISICYYIPKEIYKITLYENYFTIKLYFHKNEILYYYNDILKFNSKSTKSTNHMGNPSIDQTSKLLTNDGKIFYISPSQFENYIEIRNILFQKSNKNY